MDLSGSWEYIERIARSRLAHNKTPRHVSDYGDEIEVLGAAGEIVARRFLGLSETLHDGFDNGTDFVYAGKSVDVKATVLTPKIGWRFLQWPHWKPVKAEIVILTAVDMASMQGTVLGWVTGDEVKAAPINQTRQTPCHEIPVKSLHPGWELVQLWRQIEQQERRYSSVGYAGT